MARRVGEDYQIQGLLENSIESNFDICWVYFESIRYWLRAVCLFIVYWLCICFLVGFICAELTQILIKKFVIRISLIFDTFFEDNDFGQFRLSIVKERLLWFFRSKTTCCCEISPKIIIESFFIKVEKALAWTTLLQTLNRVQKFFFLYNLGSEFQIYRLVKDQVVFETKHQFLIRQLNERGARHFWTLTTT